MHFSLLVYQSIKCKYKGCVIYHTIITIRKSAHSSRFPLPPRPRGCGSVQIIYVQFVNKRLSVYIFSILAFFDVKTFRNVIYYEKQTYFITKIFHVIVEHKRCLLRKIAIYHTEQPVHITIRFNKNKHKTCQVVKFKRIRSSLHTYL